MKVLDKLPGFNYKPFTREDLVRNMLERKENYDLRDVKNYLIFKFNKSWFQVMTSFQPRFNYFFRLF